MNKYLVAWKREIRQIDWVLDNVGSTVLELPTGTINIDTVTEMIHDKEGDDKDHLPTRYTILAFSSFNQLVPNK